MTKSDIRQYLIDCKGYTFEDLFGLSTQEHLELATDKQELAEYLK